MRRKKSKEKGYKIYDISLIIKDLCSSVFEDQRTFVSWLKRN